MSGIVGIYHLNNRPVDKELLTKMADALRHRGLHGVGQWVRGKIGMAHMMFCTTPEAEYEKQPWTDESGQLCLTFDGRIDNRNELMDDLKKKDVHLRNDTDAEIVLQSYIQWGESCAHKIIGDFAFAIWDGRSHLLYCARDIMGIRPFFYYFDGIRFIWGSELHQFFVDKTIPRKPNEGRIGEFLAGLPKFTDDTLFHGIYRLPVAHYMIVRQNHLTKVRYWNIDSDRRITYCNDKEYTEHFLKIFKKAISCRLRSNGPIGADLSGGIDSSSVASVAHALLSQGKVPLNRFETFSWIFPGCEYDESRYIHEVVAQCNLQSNTGILEPADLVLYHEFAHRSLDFPDYPTNIIGTWNKPWSAHKKGIKVILSGVGGDNIVGSGFSHYADLLRNFGWFELAHTISKDWKADLIQNPITAIFKYGLKPLISQDIRTTTKKVFFDKEKFSHIDPRFAKRIHLPDRILARPNYPKMSYSHRQFYDVTIDGWCVKGFEITNRMQSWLGIDYRHPFLDRRLMEFCIALPEDQRRRGKIDRFILRNVMEDYLPELVRNREEKSGFDHLYIDTLHAHGGEDIFRSLAIANNGWVDRKKLCPMYQEVVSLYRQNIPMYGLKLWQLWMVHGIDIWWRTTFHL